MNRDVMLRESTIKKIIDMLLDCSKYVELAEDLGINQAHGELQEIRNGINYYDIDDMIDYLWEKIGDEK